MKKKTKKKVCRHDFNIEQCDFCGHSNEFCLKCEKGRCSAETKNGKPMKLRNPYI